LEFVGSHIVLQQKSLTFHSVKKFFQEDEGSFAALESVSAYQKAPKDTSFVPN
jgi:hypothetical protein